MPWHWQAAWRLVLEAFPWMTATCCGTHVLSLELKDMAKLPQIDAIIEKVQVVLKLFWGRKRWPRRKLREAINQRTGLAYGLYRAKQTRFAGKFREMSRMLRCKPDLQGVVVSAEYSSQKFSTRGRKEDALEDGETLDADIGSKVRAIVLDEDGFWKPLTIILHVAMPLIKLLRGMDSNKAMIGKVYDRMCSIGQRLEKLKAQGVSWASEMVEIHEYRWEYLHSDFHAAAYALDPEFLEAVGGLDGHTQQGVLNVIKKCCLRDAMIENLEKHITLWSPEVIEKVAAANLEFQTYQDNDGVFTAEEVRANAKVMEPAKWWSLHCRHLPNLTAVAQKVLSQPCAASAAERNWSVYGQIRTHQKARMKHSTADKLVYCHEALHLELKMQDAAWSPEVERWDDDDSDESDDDASDAEDDFAEGIDLTEEKILALCR